MEDESGYNLAIAEFDQDFIGTRNPVFLMRAFVFAWKYGKTPPKHILNFVARIFEDYFKASGEISLDLLFGLKKGKGQSPGLKDAARHQSEYFQMMDIFVLKNVFHKTLKDASKMVRRKYTPSDTYEQNVDLKGDDTLQQNYSRRGWDHRLKTDAFCQWYVSSFAEEQKQKFIKSFVEE